jgi:hypothetical protein
MKRTSRLLQTITLALGIGIYTLTVPLTSQSATISFFNDQSQFLQAVSAAATINFEGIVPDNSLQYYWNPVTFNGVTFSSQLGNAGLQPTILGVVGKDAQYGLTNYDSAILSEGNRNQIIANLPAGIVAVGTYIGSVEDTVNIANNLRLTLTGSIGVIDTRTVDLGTMLENTSHTFVGYVVSADTITSLRFETVSPFTNRSLGIDDFIFSSSAFPVSEPSTTPVPEPSTFLLIGAGLGGVALYRRRMKK